MGAFSITFAPADVETRIRQRLLGVQTTARQVVWRIGDQSVLIRREAVRVRLLRGWLLVALELQTDQTGRCVLELVYHLGAARTGQQSGPVATGGLGAAVKINAATLQATQLAEIWGADLQRVVWDAVLDAIELALQRAKRTNDEPAVVRGFHVGPDALTVDVLTGAL